MASDHDSLVQRLAELEAIGERLRTTIVTDSSGVEIIPNRKQIYWINHPAVQKVLCGLNQGGKSTALQILVAMHLTGLYPDWYTGHRFHHPIDMILGGKSLDRLRDTVTDDIFGKAGNRGEGMIPKHCLDESRIVLKSGGIRNCIDYAEVRHHTDGKFDGWSTCKCFIYLGTEIAGYTSHLVACDEEPPMDVYSELRARLFATKGHLIMVMTPLDGYTQLYKEFKESPEGGFRKLVTYTIDDAEHFTHEHRELLKTENALAYDVRTRLYGEPSVGEGAIYPFDVEEMTMDPRPLPKGSRQIIGLDFPHTTGYFAAVKLVFIPGENDGPTLPDDWFSEVWAIAEFKKEKVTTDECIEAVRRMGGESIPVSWPHDANRIGSGGASIRSAYSQAGLNLLPSSAHLMMRDGKSIVPTRKVSSIIQRVFQRMSRGEFRLWRGMVPKLTLELRVYRAKHDVPARHQDDHLIDSMHKAMMMARYSEAYGDARLFYHPTIPGAFGSGAGEDMFGETGNWQPEEELM